MSYASATNIATKTCIINNVTYGGSGFGVTPEDEVVFLSVRIMEQSDLGIGDRVKAFCSDNYADEATQQLPARWRALRVVVEERFADKMDLPEEPKPVPKPIVAPKPVPKILSAERVMEEVDLLLEKARPWNVNSLVLEIEDMFPVQKTVTGMETTIKTYLTSQFDAGRVVKAAIFSGPAPGTLSGVYYATTTEVLEEHLSTAMED